MTTAEIIAQAEAEYDELFINLLLFGEKTCTACGAKLPANREHFRGDKQKSDGLTSACIACRDAASAAWHARKRAES